MNCLCPTCESIELLCDGINTSSLITLPTKGHELLLKIACDPLTEECANGSCDKCPSIDLECLDDVGNIPFYQWVKETYYKKQLSELPACKMKAKLKDMFSVLKVHYYQKKGKTYKKHISDLTDDDMVIHVDYSENYNNKQQGEIKSAFYGQGQFSIYTACIYLRSENGVVCKGFALVTVENDHSWL